VRTTISAHNRGQIMLLTAMAIIMLLGFVGLAIDISFFYTSKRHMQTAADAAAIAAAKALRNNGTYGSATKAAKDVARLNGFDVGANGVTVTAEPPKTSPYNTAGYVQVTVARPEPTFFLKVLGFNSMNVSARAISGAEDAPSCIYTLDSSTPSSLNLTGSSQVNMACGVMVGSNSSTALNVSGSASLTASSIGVVGGTQSSKGISPSPRAHIALCGDPLASLAPPSSGPLQSATMDKISGTGNGKGKGKQVTLSPGLYRGGIQVTNNANVRFDQGTYVLAGGGLSVTGSSTISGVGVTFYNTTGPAGYKPISISGDGNSILSAPTSGVFKGILFFQDRAYNGNDSSMAGDAASTFDGVLYFPTAGLTFTGNSSSSGYTVLIADRLTVSGNSSIGSNYSSLDHGSPIQASALYE
jgi:hypothetical protein